MAERAALELRLGAVVDGKPSPWITIQEKAVRAIDAAAPVAAEPDRSQDAGAAAGLYRANAVGIEARHEGVAQSGAAAVAWIEKYCSDWAEKYNLQHGERAVPQQFP